MHCVKNLFGLFKLICRSRWDEFLLTKFFNVFVRPVLIRVELMKTLHVNNQIFSACVLDWATNNFWSPRFVLSKRCFLQYRSLLDRSIVYRSTNVCKTEVAHESDELYDMTWKSTDKYFIFLLSGSVALTTRMWNSFMQKFRSCRKAALTRSVDHENNMQRVAFFLQKKFKKHRNGTVLLSYNFFCTTPDDTFQVVFMLNAVPENSARPNSSDLQHSLRNTNPYHTQKSSY